MARFQTTGIVIDYSEDGWAEFKKWIDGTYASLRYAWVDEGSAYTVLADDGGITRLVSFNKTDASDFETNYKNTTPASFHIDIHQKDGAVVVAPGANLSGSEFIQSSHNFADPTTWYSDSGSVVDEVATDSGDGITWNSANNNWIDLYHGKLMREEDLVDDYNVTVKVDDVTKTMRDPFSDDFSGGGDYYVDFENGDVIFSSSQAGSTVKVSYSYENGSGWYLYPSTGKILYLKEAEVNGTKDIVFNDTLCYYIQTYIEGFGWYTVGDAFYKSLVQMVQECRGSFPVIPAFGGTKRGMQSDIIQIPFVYVADRELKDSDNVRLNVRLENDIAMGGEHASITFYCLSRSE